MHSVWIGCSVLDRRELTCESVCDGACSSRPSWETAGRMLKSSGTLGCGLPRLGQGVCLPNAAHIWGFNKTPISCKFSPLHQPGGAGRLLIWGSVSWRERSSSVLLYVTVSLSSK